MGDNRAHNPWYSTSRWQKRRAGQLREFPLCAMCLGKGLPVAATVADHVRPHQGDNNSFWFGELQSLCATCHSSTKKLEEFAANPPRHARKFSLEVGEDGWPIDPAHPANQPREQAGSGVGRNKFRTLKILAGGGGLQKAGRSSA